MTLNEGATVGCCQLSRLLVYNSEIKTIKENFTYKEEGACTPSTATPLHYFVSHFLRCLIRFM